MKSVKRSVRRPAASSKGRGPRVKQKGLQWIARHDVQCVACKFSHQRHRHLRVLQKNLFFNRLGPRRQKCLVLERCRFDYRKPWEAPVTYDIQCSAGRVPRSTTGSTCQMPMGCVWLEEATVAGIEGGRFQLGIDSLLLQGCYIPHLVAVKPGRFFSKFLQDMAGNAFNCVQFSNFVLAALLTG